MAEAARDPFPDPVEFGEKLNALVASKKNLKQTSYFTRKMYDDFLAETKAAEQKKTGSKALDAMDGRRLARFSVVKFPGQPERLVEGTKGKGKGKKRAQVQQDPEAAQELAAPKPPLTFVCVDELHDLLRGAHSDSCHGGKHRMTNMLNEKYKNITEEVILLYLSLCPTCITKRNPVRRGITVRPMVFRQMNDRMQVDLVDMQSSEDGGFKWIMNAQDHLTKFTHLRPLASKTAREVADNLVDIFLIFGAPCILQSDNGREFCNAVITSLQETWPELRIVHGAPRHSQSQGSVERSNWPGHPPT